MICYIGESEALNFFPLLTREVNRRANSPTSKNTPNIKEPQIKPRVYEENG